MNQASAFAIARQAAVLGGVRREVLRSDQGAAYALKDGTYIDLLPSSGDGAGVTMSQLREVWSPGSQKIDRRPPAKSKKRPLYL